MPVADAGDKAPLYQPTRMLVDMICVLLTNSGSSTRLATHDPPTGLKHRQAMILPRGIVSQHYSW